MQSNDLGLLCFSINALQNVRQLFRVLTSQDAGIRTRRSFSVIGGLRGPGRASSTHPPQIGL
jgi:hypothetical protein